VHRTALVRDAEPADLAAIRRIYNEGIEDRVATLDEEPKDEAEMLAWWSDHAGRYAVLVAEDQAHDVIGWASLNPYSHRCAHRGIADLSVYVARSARGTGIASALLEQLEQRATSEGFHKIVLFMLQLNEPARALYTKFGYRDIGVFREQGLLDGRFVDVTAMEKLLVARSRTP
jgi:phosphinothricin acetyltransferase